MSAQMSDAERQKLITRIYSDASFQKAVLADPRKTLTDNNFTPDETVIAALQSLNENADNSSVIASAQSVFNEYAQQYGGGGTST